MEKNKFWLIILFAVIVYLVMGIYTSFGNLLSALEKFNWIFLPIMIILVTLAYLVRFVKWNFFLRNVGVYLPVKENLFVFISGLSMTITPAKAGEIWKGWLIRGINGESLSKTVPVVIVDRVTDFVGLVILSFSGILFYKSGIYVLLILVLLFAVFIFMIKSKTISTRLISLLEGRAGKYNIDVKDMHQTFQRSVTSKYLVGLSLLAVLAWFLECLSVFFVIKGFGTSMNIIISTFLYSFSTLLGAVSFIPGGLGVTEASLSGFLVLFGLTSSIAVGAALVIRLGTLWYGAILGFLIYTIFNKRIMKYKT